MAIGPSATANSIQPKANRFLLDAMPPASTIDETQKTKNTNSIAVLLGA